MTKTKLLMCALVSVAMAAQGQQTKESLGDAARRQREAQKPATAKVLTNDDLAAKKAKFKDDAKQGPADLGVNLSPLEQKTLLTFVGFRLAEEMCKMGSGKYLPAEELLKNGCPSSRGGMPPPTLDKEGSDNYRFRIHLTSGVADAIPRKPGLGWFYTDDQGIYYNPTKTASNKDKKLENLEAFLNENLKDSGLTITKK